MRNDEPGSTNGKHKVITLCGSTRFRQQFERINAELTLQGHVVISVGVFVHAGGQPVTEARKTMLDSVHLQKIDMADEIFVVNPGGYIGESTGREIEYARRKGIPVRYLEQPGTA